MIALEELKKDWKAQPLSPDIEKYDLALLKRTVKSRIQKHKKMALQYFRTHLLLQLLVYLLLVYVIVEYRFDTVILTVSLAGLALYVPFTIFLYKRAREVVSGSLNECSVNSLYNSMQESYRSLRRFYKFKKMSDVVLTPLSCVIGTYLTFELLIPGGIHGSIYLTLVTFVVTLISCYANIAEENRKKFKEPLKQLQELMNEF